MCHGLFQPLDFLGCLLSPHKEKRKERVTKDNNKCVKKKRRSKAKQRAAQAFALLHLGIEAKGKRNQANYIKHRQLLLRLFAGR